MSLRRHYLALAAVGLACRPAQLSERCDCGSEARLTYAAAVAPLDFPNDDEIGYWIGRDLDDDERIRGDEVVLFWSHETAELPTAIAVDQAGSALYVLFANELHVLIDEDADHRADAVHMTELDREAVGVVVDGSGAAVVLLTDPVELRRVDTAGQTSSLWTEDGAMSGEAGLALSTAGRRGAFLISDPAGDMIWTVDTGENTIEAFLGESSAQLPGNSMNYSPVHGLVWIGGTGFTGPLHRLRDGDGEPETYLDEPHCDVAMAVGIGQAGGSIVWANQCGRSPYVWDPPAPYEALPVPQDGVPGALVALAASPDPCQSACD